MSEQLRTLTKRWLSFGEVLQVPADPPALLDRLTDELLIVASDAVRTEVELHRLFETVSGKAHFRLLAWVIADARGADTPLDKQLAETVGKRLERQAQKVRDDVSLAAATAQQARACARLAAAADGSLLAALPAELAAIDAAEKLALEAPRNEVYVGFHELISLLPRTPEPPTATAAPTAASVWAAALQAAEPTNEPEIPSIPDDLAHSLGRDGVQALWNHHHRDDHCEQQLLAESADWWKYLPSLVAHTLIDSAWAYQEGKADGVSEVSESMREDEDKQVQISVLLQEKNALLEARVAQLERQLRQQARGEKVAVPAGLAPRATHSGSKRARD